MYDWGYKLSPEELAPIAKAADSCRRKWQSIKPPWSAAFDLSTTDIAAMDYMEYEGIPLPSDVGLEGAALICGEVLRRAANLEWFKHYHGDWFIASHDDDIVAEVAICPVARLYEIKASGPAYGKYRWFLEQGAIECLLRIGHIDVRRNLQQFIEINDSGQRGEMVMRLQHLLTTFSDPKHQRD